MTRTHHQRRLPCHRHPTSTPTGGLCSSCLRERLASIDYSSPAALAPQLRRTRSHCSRPEPHPSSIQQPRRRSCDVRPPPAGTLHDLFAVDDGNKLDFCPDLKEDDEEYGELEEEEIDGFDKDKQGKHGYEMFEEGGDCKTMKEFIDLEWGNNSRKSNGGNLKDIASVLGQKLRKWSMKHHDTRNPEGALVSDGQVQKGLTQSGVAEHGLGWQSCDVDPVSSLDAGMLSFEEPRSTWDGCLIGRTNPQVITPLASVKEDVKDPPANNVGVDEDKEEKNPGGSAQTRDYYADSRRRRSFDRSNFSIMRRGLQEIDELKAISTTKVSPETVGLFHGAKLLVTEKELRDSNWYSIKNYKPESVECASKGMENIAGEVSQEGFGLKKPRRKWSKGWNIWGLMIQKKNETKHDVKLEKGLKLEGNVVEGSLAESLLKLRMVAKGEANGTVSQKLIRSYSVSARNSCDGMFHGINGVEGGKSSFDGVFRGVDCGKSSCGKMRHGSINGVEGGRSSCDGLFHGGIKGVEGGRNSCDGLFPGVGGKSGSKKSKDIHLIPQNANTGGCSPNKLENGLMRFYLTPLRSSKTSKSGKSRRKNSSCVMGSVV